MTALVAFGPIILTAGLKMVAIEDGRRRRDGEYSDEGGGADGGYIGGSGGGDRCDSGSDGGVETAAVAEVKAAG